jgi:diguanylate cyclase (GGDEF)-like protein
MDPLTGIPNRRKLLDVNGQTLGRNKFTGVIVFDVDHLKAINDVFGHLAGDAVLKVVADRAKECVRKTDVLIRYGGDEFLILLPETRRHAVLEIAERLRKGVQSSQLEIQGRLVSATISVGFACLRGELDFSRLIRCADQALFAAKQRGRNRVVGSDGAWTGSRESLA